MGYQPYNMSDNDGLKIALIFITALMVCYCIVGFATSCPKCNEWYVRQVYEKEFLYQNEVKCSDQIAHHMYDSNGNIVSTWYTYDDYIRVDNHYKYFNVCSKCTAKWITFETESYRRRY